MRHDKPPCQTSQTITRRTRNNASGPRQAGVTLSYIGRLETGRHDPQLSTLTKLAKALKVRVGELVA
jgi:predicted transcriptional regulator